MMNLLSARVLMLTTILSSFSATTVLAQWSQGGGSRKGLSFLKNAGGLLHRNHQYSSDSDPGTIEPLVSWNKRSIRVCWRNSALLDPIFEKNDFNDLKKQAVQEIIQKEYTIERVGIEFIGWQNCNELKTGSYDFEIIQDNFSAKPNPVVQPYRDRAVEGMAFIGEGGGCYRLTENDPFSDEPKVTVGYYYRNAKEEKKVYLMFVDLNDIFENSFTSLKRLQSTALHEFGHVAGLRHEHIRPEAMDDPNCRYMGKDFVVEEKPYDTTRYIGEYDPNSIMNYCWLATLEAVGLKTSELPNMTDPSLYEKVSRMEVTKKTVLVGKKPNQKKKVVTVKKPVSEYELRVGLSQRDVTALQEMYLKRK